MAVIAVPSYGGRVPGTAAGRLGAIRGNGARAVLVCVYGNRAYEDTLVELQDIAKQAGFRVTAAVAAVAEHSIAGSSRRAVRMHRTRSSCRALEGRSGRSWTQETPQSRRFRAIAPTRRRAEPA